MTARCCCRIRWRTGTCSHTAAPSCPTYADYTSPDPQPDFYTAAPTVGMPWLYGTVVDPTIEVTP